MVRIESPDRLDLLRTVPPFKDGVPGPDRAQFMANFNTSKLGMTVDLKNAEGRKLARRMVDWADVVLESYSPGTMARFGLDWATLSADRDDLVMLSTSMRGQTGRERKYSGFGGQGSAIGGLYALVGWPDRPPCGPWGAYTDFITPRFGVATLTAALLHRRRTGLGQHIDLSQIECGIRFLEPLILDYAATGKVATALGQESPSLDPHGVFACGGDNRYVAIGVETSSERSALAKLLGGEELADWCRSRDAFEAATTLRRAEVPAYVVLRTSDLYDDPQLAHRGFFVTPRSSGDGPNALRRPGDDLLAHAATPAVRGTLPRRAQRTCATRTVGHVGCRRRSFAERRGIRPTRALIPGGLAYVTTPPSRPPLHSNPLEVLEVAVVRRDDDQIVDVCDGRDLAVDVRRCLPGGNQSGTLASMPVGGLLIVVQHREARQNDVLQVAFECVAAPGR